MARNSQKVDPRHMVCENCRMGACEVCIDVSLILAGREGFCQCKRKGHDGEPRDKQILDPETGTVHAPGLTVDIDGKVTFHGKA
jgi:hypothetical protein